MIDIDEARTRLAEVDRFSDEAKDLQEQIMVATSTETFLGQVKTLLEARIEELNRDKRTHLGSWMVSQGVRTDGDVLRCHHDELFSISLRPEDFEWVVAIHRNDPHGLRFDGEMWDREGWVAYSGLKAPGYFPADLTAPATAVADYLAELIRRVA